MTARQTCAALQERLHDHGYPHLAVRFIPGEGGGYYVAPKSAQSAYGALGVGSDFPAHSMTKREAIAFVGGLVMSKEAEVR